MLDWLFMKLTKVRAVDPADPAQVDEMMRNLRPVIPKARALLCLDCEVIFEAEGAQRCPACGSPVAWSIGRALDRDGGEAVARG